MKKKIHINSLLLGAFAGAVMVLCVAAATTKTNAVSSPSSIVIPPAQSYSVQIGHSEYIAKSVKIDGDWISFATDRGQGPATIFAPRSSVVFIEAHQAK